VGPHELFGDSILRHVAKFAKEGATLEIEVEAISKAQFLLALEGVGFSAEWEFYGTTALLVARKHLLADLLGEAESEETVLDLLLLCCNLFK
jgi:hypothetical protein